MRSHFDEQLGLLNKNLTQMGALCEEAIALAAKALVTGDVEMAARVSPVDDEIDRMERSIESMCLKLLLHQHPVASDLRQISAALKMITDMERIGDQADDIAEIVPYIAGNPDIDCELIGEMAKATIKMVTDSVNAFVKRDIAIAENVIEYDDIVDDYFFKVKSSLMDMIVSSPASSEYILDLLMIAKYFERIGDHATNIAEWVVFSVTGERKEEMK